jgi:glutamate-5-semialdehyde dehydrogenase
MEKANSTRELAKKAKQACIKIANSDEQTRNRLLFAISQRIKENASLILSTNKKDVALAGRLVADGKLSRPLLNRLILTPAKINQLSIYLEEVAKLKDPVGGRQYAMKLAEGLELERLSCPIGLIAIIFESRPEVVVQVTALSLKSGNGVILKGGTEASHTNRVLFDIIADVLKTNDLSHTVNLIETRGDVAELLKLDDTIDLIIPRGSNEFVRYIQDHTKIPVLGHSSGICHIYIDQAYDKNMVIPVVLDAKLDYPSACNAMETLLIHQKAAEDLLADLITELSGQGVRCLGCENTIKISARHGLTLEKATEQDWSTEYSDLVLSIKTVDSAEQAIDHINTYGSHHTDSIITADPDTAAFFLKQVDSACVFHNASTRFSDGYVFGLGAEVGISTNKTHARGPVGLEGMVIYKYILRGSGQLRSSFSGTNAQPFIHQPLS